MMVDQSENSLELAPFQTSSLVDTAYMLHLAKVTSEDTVIDLGCGDGRILVEAAKLYGSQGIGVELDEALVCQARERAIRENIAKDKVIIHNKDIRNVRFFPENTTNNLENTVNTLENTVNTLENTADDNLDIHTDPSKTVIILFMLPDGMVVVQEQLKHALRKGCRVVAQNWGIPGLRPVQIENRGHIQFELYNKMSVKDD